MQLDKYISVQNISETSKGNEFEFSQIFDFSIPGCDIFQVN